MIAFSTEKQPNSVAYVVKRLFSFSYFRCQNPSCRSRVEKNLLSASSVRRSSSKGFRAFFSTLGSMQTRSLPFFLILVLMHSPMVLGH